MKKSVIRQLLLGAALLFAVAVAASITAVLAFRSEQAVLSGLRRLETLADGVEDLVASAAALSDPGVDVRRALADLGEAQTALEEAWIRDLDPIRLAMDRSGLASSLEEPRFLLESGLRDLNRRMVSAYGRDGGMAGEWRRYREGASDLAMALRRIREQAMAGREAWFTRALFIFLLAALFGTLSVGLSIFVVLLRLSRDLKKLRAYGRDSSDGGAGEPPELQRNDELAELLGYLKAMHAAQETVRRMRDASERILQEQKRATEGSISLLGLASDQAAALGRTSRGFSDASEQFRMIAENAAAAREASEESTRGLENFLEKIGEGISRARALEQSTAEIEEVVTSIGDIADQTELLSLNAAIEAAHVGESGKGFAVLSQQVRKLADKSARQASDIGDLIQTVASAVRANANDARQFSDILDALKASFLRLSAALSRITDLIRTGQDSIEKVDRAIAAVQDLVEQGAQKAQGITATQKTIVQETDSLLHGAPREAMAAPGPVAVSEAAPGPATGPHEEDTPPGSAPVPPAAKESAPSGDETPAAASAAKVAPAGTPEDGLEELEAVEE
jgi:methyl-accepting chemotaxis protein